MPANNRPMEIPNREAPCIAGASRLAGISVSAGGAGENDGADVGDDSGGALGDERLPAGCKGREVSAEVGRSGCPVL
jgi:hypothetical protein